MDNKEDIFDIRVNEDGKKLVNRIYQLVVVCFWIGLAVEAIILVSGAINYFRYRDITFIVDKGYYWYLRIYTVYIILFSALTILQSVYFLNFTKQAQQSIRINDSHGFNHSFIWMYKSLKITLVCIIINGLFFIYGLF